jgi:flagellar FliL protein
MNTNQKTADVISKIAESLEIETTSNNSGASSFGRDAQDIPASESANYEIKELTLALSDGNYLQCSVVFSMDTQAADYATMGTSDTLSGAESKIKSIITDVVSSYSIDTVSSSKKEIEKAILERMQEYFKSTFIYEVSFSQFIPVKT